MKSKLEIENKIKQLEAELEQNKPNDTPSLQKQFVFMVNNCLIGKIELLKWILQEK